MPVNEKRVYEILFAVALIIFIIATIFTKYNPLEIFFNFENFWAFLSQDFFPPMLPRASKIHTILNGILVTVTMAIGSTTTAALLAFVVALFASNAVSPVKGSAKIVRGIATFLRNIPALVWAFILFSSLGIGTGVGFIALFITSFAFMVRAFAETMDDISAGAIESLQSSGTGFIQTVIHGVIPGCMNGFLSWYLYCIEVNIRASTIVGMVGGGGIGLVLFSYIKGFKYHIAFAIILIIAAIVIAVDLINGRLRKALGL